MNEEELKALVGDKAFEAMSEDQRKAAIAKFTPPKKDDDGGDKDKGDKSKSKKDDDDDDDLNDRVRKQKEAEAAKAAETKGLESAITFNFGVKKFVEDNVDLLPSDIPDLLKAAEAEKYDSAVQKAAAIKQAFVKSFFNVQSNVDLLTAAQKASLDEFQNLTKNGKEEKIQAIYENLFEPALETLKKVKKAEELGKARSGFASSSKAEDSYKQKLMDVSRKAYLNQKGA